MRLPLKQYRVGRVETGRVGYLCVHDDSVDLSSVSLTFSIRKSFPKVATGMHCYKVAMVSNLTGNLTRKRVLEECIIYYILYSLIL